MHKSILFLLLLFIAFSSCRKENNSEDCGSLKDGIAANDMGKVKTAVTGFIAGLDSRDYNHANIHALAQRIAASCGVTVESTCFDCIQTLPSQTEIRITVNAAGSAVSKTIDLSYTPANEITFHNMHD